MEQVLESPTESARGGSAASWPAIVAGAFVAASVSLVLLALGSGLGFAAISPWSGRGVTATTFAVTTAIWLIVMQWVSSAFGGYITGRLRTRWVGAHTHEVFFRDTAHGLVMWAVATVLVAATLATSLSSAIGGGVHAVSSAASVPDADRSYLAEMLATRTGLSPTDAQKRVDEFLAAATDAEYKIKADAEAARKAAAKAAIYTALSMLVGAFIASVSAAAGGRLRDEHL
jgi:hypothetical protein